QGWPRRWQRVILILTLLLTIAGSIEFGRALVMCVLPPQFSNDGTSLDTNAAVLLLEGRNPYTDSNMLDMAERFSIQPNWTTPLQQGQFANREDYPTMVDFQTVLDTDIKAGKAPEFESKVSYPALSFLTLVPFALFKDYNVLPFYLLSYLVLVAIAWKVARPEMRSWVLLLALANVSMWSSTVGGNLDIFYTLLIVLVWLTRDKRWSSALFLGLAMASKQIAWFFLPFYAIMLLRQYGMKEVVYRMAIAGSIGLAFNLPFILWNPQAWLAGILAPMADPMFPMGVGPISLSIAHLVPFLPKWVYTVMEGVAMLGSLAWYWRICKKFPEAAMFLAVLPLFFAWRSLSSYFYCSAFPLFVLMVSRLPLGAQVATQAKTQLSAKRGITWYEGSLAGMPAITNMHFFAYPWRIFRSL
ncbi:MAG: glycosyltransferase 87 family protein, partial [Ktedonobacteraceae bacterium]